MNPQTPPYRSPEQRLKGLFIAGNILGGILLFAILITLVVNKKRAHMQEMARIDLLIDSIQMSDSLASVDYALEEVIDDYTYSSNDAADYQESLNDDVYTRFYTNLSDTSSINSLLYELQSLTDAACKKMRKMQDQFQDSTNYLYSSDEAQVSRAFFINSGRSTAILNELHQYRTDANTLMEKMNISGIDLSCGTLPLDDCTPLNGATSWDTRNFKGSYYSATEYLKTLEGQIRNYESSLLDRASIYYLY
jgi:hypothetical protein